MQARLQRELELTPGQARQIEPIVQRMAREFKSVQVTSVQQMAGVISNQCDEISRVLTPAQQAKLKQLEHDRIERLNKSCR
jgi:Spy/CpxP family protein refolding chaperone